MDSMILGRYIPGDSIIHRLDPRSKLLAMILLILIVFWANNPLTNLILFVATGIFIALSGVSLSFCTTKIGQKIETTKSKTLFLNILDTFFRPPRIFFRRPKNHFPRKRGRRFLWKERPPAYHPSLPFLCASSQSHVGVLAWAEKFWG